MSSATDSHWTQIDTYSETIGFEWNHMLAIIGISDYTNTISLDKDDYDWFDLTSANNLMSAVKERGHFFEHDFGSDLNTVTGASNLLDQTRWAAMQNFFTSNCQNFVHTNSSYYIKNISTNSNYTIHSNCKHFPTFAEIEVNRAGLFNINVPSDHSAWFEFCMEVGLYGIYSEGGVTQLKWGFQYANEDSGWKITRPGSSNATTNGKRLATYKDAVYKAKPPGESMQYYSSALVDDLKKCLDFDIKVKYILDDFGRKNEDDDLIGITTQNQYAYNDWEVSTSGHEGKNYIGDADGSIGTNSSPFGKTDMPVWIADFVSLSNSFELAKDDAIDEGTTITTDTSAKPDFIGNQIKTSYDMYMTFIRDHNISSGEGSFMFIDVEGKYYKLDPASNGFIKFKGPTGATYKLTGEKLLSQVGKPQNIVNFNSFGMGMTEGLQDLSIDFASESTSAVGYVTFGYDWANTLDFSYAATPTAVPLSADIDIYFNTSSNPEVVSVEETAFPVCRSIVKESPSINSVSIGGSNLPATFGGYAKFEMVSSDYILGGSSNEYIRGSHGSFSNWLSTYISYYLEGPTPEEQAGGAIFETEFKLTAGENTPWEDVHTESHFYKVICVPSEE